MAAPDLSDNIEEVAGAPKKSSGDNGSVEEHDLDDMIKADRYLRARSAGLGAGFKISKLIPGGASGQHFGG
jgi:hypothetical protein